MTTKAATGEPRRVRLATVATATPPYLADQQEAEAFFLAHFAHRLSPRSVKLLRTFLAHPSIRGRHFAFPDPHCLVQEDADERIGRFTRWAVELSAQAARSALAQTGVTPGEISTLVVNTCTGYLCPGLTSYLMESLGLPSDIRAYDLVGSGCGGAVPNLQLGADHLKANGGGVALCISVEVCSATFQMEDDLSLILSNALFGDGAAAALLWSCSPGLELVAAVSRHRPEDREAIRYIHKQGQLYNQLSAALPRIAGGAVAEAVQALLAPRGLTAADIHHWALHGGGHKVISAVGEKLGLPEAKLQPTRDVLARYGNMSSPSVLFSLKEILETGLNAGEWVVLAAFGAGLSVHALLLQAPEQEEK